MPIFAEYCMWCNPNAKPGMLCSYHEHEANQGHLRVRKKLGYYKPARNDWSQRFGSQDGEIKEETSDGWHWCDICEENVAPSHGH